MIYHLKTDCNNFFQLLCLCYVEGFILKNQRGSFLLQALLALTLVFVFMPFFATKFASRDMAAQMYATTSQVETLYTASRIYLREMKDDLQYKKQELTGEDLVDTLESYGLPLGFIPTTAFKQNLAFIIDKNENGVSGYIKISGGNLSRVQLAELARRIGFYANIVDGNIEVSVPIDSMYSDIVAKKETGENIGFLSELDMNDNNVDKISILFSRNGEFETAQFNSLSLYGLESGRSDRNKISDLFANRTVFQSSDGGAALSLTRGELTVNYASLRTISKFGTPGTFESNTAAVYEFSMSEGRTSFNGPGKWKVGGTLRADNFSFVTERFDIGSYIDASRGQDVYIDPTSLTYTSKVGVNVKNISVSNITLRDQTSYGLLNGQSGAAIIDIRPAGTTLLPDIYLDSVNNDSFEIIADPKDTTGKKVSCKEIITNLDGNYNSKSLAQNIICQYVFWQRLEKRINIKQCLQAGRDDCIK